MQAKPTYRDRPDAEVAVLDALVERGEEGMTVFELRAAVDVGIDGLEGALASLAEDDLIHVDRTGGSVRITAAERVIPETPDEGDRRRGFLGTIRERLGL